MIIKKYTAKTELEAIEQAKADLGPNAVVMNVKKVQPKGLRKLFAKAKVEVTAALDENQDYSQGQGKKTAPGKEDKKEGKHIDLVTPEEEIAIPPMPEEEGEGRESDEEKILREKLMKLETLLEQQMNSPKPKDEAKQKDEEQEDKKRESKEEEKEEEKDQDSKEEKKEEDMEDRKTKACKDLIYKQLLQSEVDEKIADSFMKELDQSLPEKAPVDQILASVYQRIILTIGQPYLIDSKTSDKTKFIFFLGSTGVGKTTTIAKIASKLKLEKKAKVALVTADTYRIAAVEQLKTYANILSIPLKVVYTSEELGGILDELNEYDYCLIDTAGRSHKNKDQIKDIQELIDQVPVSERQVYLVLNAGTKYSDLKEIARVYSKMTDYSIIFTKLDETSSAGVMLNMRSETKCPLSYVTWGQNVPDDIGVVDAQKIAKQLLGGK
ncbi:MAG: flagellar biosynthesis protein FlhF [Eubacterium sp.]|nr:flagellar biosynthesis protein FlhF [Eubacterium sp.]